MNVKAVRCLINNNCRYLNNHIYFCKFSVVYSDAFDANNKSVLTAKVVPLPRKRKIMEFLKEIIRALLEAGLKLNPTRELPTKKYLH